MIRYENATELEEHMKNHNQNGGIMCEICAKLIKGQNAFRIHQLEHKGVEIPRVKCDECNATYKNKRALYVHKRNDHDKTGPIQCNICKKMYANKHKLRRHQNLVHNTVPNYQCKECGKSFKTAYVYREHLFSHTGERRYQCQQCSKSFMYRANMYTHQRRVHINPRKSRKRGRPLGSGKKGYKDESRNLRGERTTECKWYSLEFKRGKTRDEMAKETKEHVNE